MKPRTAITVLFATIALLAASAVCLFHGAVHIPPSDVLSILSGQSESVQPSWTYIVLETRLPALLTAIVAGASLGVAGLLLQTTFNNPLAGPSILGISTGASLGVALVMLALGAAVGVWGQAAILLSALGGAGVVLSVLLGLASLLHSSTMLLIAGILVGYLGSSAIALLNFFASRDGIANFVAWGLGSFSSVPMSQMALMGGLCLLLCVGAVFCAKPLDAMLLGVNYASSAGINIRRVRALLLLISGALTAIVTAWCGPIAFMGLMVPHIARLALGGGTHLRLLPVTILCGAATGAFCQAISVAPGAWGIIPVNAITPIVGVPLIIYLILRRRNISYFN